MLPWLLMQISNDGTLKTVDDASNKNNEPNNNNSAELDVVFETTTNSMSEVRDLERCFRHYAKAQQYVSYFLAVCFGSIVLLFVITFLQK